MTLFIDGIAYCVILFISIIGIVNGIDESEPCAYIVGIIGILLVISKIIITFFN
jgi:hypothetical protein